MEKKPVSMYQFISCKNFVNTKKYSEFRRGVHSLGSGIVPGKIGDIRKNRNFEKQKRPGISSRYFLK
jgi:hypothetical protein